MHLFSYAVTECSVVSVSREEREREQPCTAGNKEAGVHAS